MNNAPIQQASNMTIQIFVIAYQRWNTPKSNNFWYYPEKMNFYLDWLKMTILRKWGNSWSSVEIYPLWKDTKPDFVSKLLVHLSHRQQSTSQASLVNILFLRSGVSLVHTHLVHTHFVHTHPPSAHPPSAQPPSAQPPSAHPPYAHSSCAQLPCVYTHLVHTHFVHTHPPCAQPPCAQPPSAHPPCTHPPCTDLPLHTYPKWTNFCQTICLCWT